MLQPYQYIFFPSAFKKNNFISIFFDTGVSIVGYYWAICLLILHRNTVVSIGMGHLSLLTLLLMYLNRLTKRIHRYFCTRTFFENTTLNAFHGPLTRYVKLRVAHALGMPGTFSSPSRVDDPDMHHSTCVTHVPWCMLRSLTSWFLRSRWRGKRSRHSRRMRNPQFYVSGKGPMELPCVGFIFPTGIFCSSVPGLMSDNISTLLCCR